ncbi:MAG TPA: sigma-70 family RNA polymerase sigma factor [Burkholderiales bacterium]|jgi:RNA polymerase sigma-70 factor (ECF subfamily)|nr:sigma-70 family RNA polymerase sigma factor [Burkholderiales bacterium]
MFDTKQARFERLVRAYSAELFRYAYWICRDRFIAEDLVQETFARAWSAWASLRDEAAAKSWLYTILRNENARLYERKRVDVTDGVDLDTIEDQRLRSISAEIEMRDALHALPEGYREPLLLQVVGGFSCDDIARIMNLTTGAVMTRLSRARLALRQGAGHIDSRKESS